MAVQNYLTLSHLRKAVASITQKITSDLVGLTDTSITSPTNGQALLYDSTSSKWKNEDLPKAAFLVTITGTTENDVTTYTADKTFAETLAAYNEGKAVYAINNNQLYYLSQAVSQGMVFSRNSANRLFTITWTASSGRIFLNDIIVPTASSTTPSSDGTGAVGVSTSYARADHVHPKITQSLSISANVITLTGSDGTTSSVTLPVYDGGVSS